MKIVAALSGGVDSSVAAARMVAAGHQVVGVHLALARDPHQTRAGSRGCCSVEDSRDARRVADKLGIPFYVWDLSEQFHREVMGDFLAEYAAGRTPNPCLRCNEKIKFAAVVERALALGYEAVCTGHYARIVQGPSGRELHRAVDPDKDQSYVLGVLSAPQLAASLFPLGDTPKHQVRHEAEVLGLAVARKPDSHDICFIPDGDTAGFLREKLGASKGNFVDQRGEIVGQHEGAFAYTVGQRRGLHLGNPAADGRPRYVLGITPVTNTVTVGPRELLEVSAVQGVYPRWPGPAPQAEQRFACHAQVRAHGQPVAAHAWVADQGRVLRVELEQPLMGVATGQAVVLYEGTRVIGSATISATTAVEAGAPGSGD